MDPDLAAPESHASPQKEKQKFLRKGRGFETRVAATLVRRYVPKGGFIKTVEQHLPKVSKLKQLRKQRGHPDAIGTQRSKGSNPREAHSPVTEPGAGANGSPSISRQQRSGVAKIHASRLSARSESARQAYDPTADGSSDLAVPQQTLEEVLSKAKTARPFPQNMQVRGRCSSVCFCKSHKPAGSPAKCGTDTVCQTGNLKQEVSAGR